MSSHSAGRRIRVPRSRNGKSVRLALSLGLISAAFVLLPLGSASAAASLSLTKDGDSTVLVGSQAHFSLTATNNGDTDQYNATFRDELPVGVTYKASSTAPSAVGEPTVLTDPVDGHQTLIWSNTADLPVGASTRLSFDVEIDPAVFPVGSSFVNVANVYSSTNPRQVARVDALGHVVPGTFAATATSSPHQVTITALKVVKSEGSPEGELLRGIHDQTTVYSLKVTNNAAHPTNAITLVDFLPAGLEFLGCGGVDNGPLEYAGAPALTATPAVAPCFTPDTVETVTDPPGRSGVFTKVTWTLTNLAAGGTETVRYRAGIPQRANTMSFASGTPTAGSLQQTANLDNNNGPSTRETDVEQALTNTATVTGSYTGITTNGQSTVSDTSSTTVTAEDVALQKTASTDSFQAGQIVTYTLTVRGSEYVDGSDIVVTDQLPNGMCPLSSTTSYDAASGCAAAAGQDPGGSAGAAYQSVVAGAGGTYDITFTPITLAHNETRTITFQARMKASYAGGDPTLSGDSFTNNTSLNGKTDSLATNPPTPGQEEVGDESSHTMTSDAPTLDKTIKANSSSYACPGGSYGDPAAANDPTVVFSAGSRVCFRIRVDFSSANQTKNPVLTDFLPDDIAYEAGSAVVSTGPGSVTGVLDPTDLIWRIGTASGSNRFAPAASFFEVTFSGIVTSSADGPTPDVTGNLAKLRWVDSNGAVSALRDRVPFSIAPVPPVAIDKSAARLTGAPGYPTGPLADGATVVAGNQLEYSLKVTNNGSAAAHSDRDVIGPDVWDVLPAGITCAAISAISPGGVCTDPGAATHPSFASNDTLSAIRWNLDDSVVIAPGASRTVTYQLAVPTGASVGISYKNVSAVASYGSPTNIDTVTQHHPAQNIDTTVTPDQVDAPAAQDDFTVVTPKSALTKANTTSVTETGNAAVGQATIGELVDYTVTVTVPAHTTLYGGVLSDPAPTGVSYLGTPTLTFSDGAGGTTLPAGTTATQTTTAAGITFPASYANTSDVAHTFTLLVHGRITTLAGNTHGTVRTNSATLTSTSTAGGTAVPAVSATSDVTVVEPKPTLAKTDDVPGTVSGGQTLTFTLAAGNTGGRPILHDAFVIDCVPAVLTFGSFTTVPGGTTATTVAGGAPNPCASGTTAIIWNAGDILGGTGNTKVLTYTATVDAASAGGISFVNTATITGSSLDDDDTTPGQVNPVERPYSVTKDNTNSVTKALLTKSTSTPVRTIGQTAAYTVVVTLPHDVTFFDTLVHDLLPAGLDPASVTLGPVTCAPGCSLTATPVTPNAAAGGASDIGWTLGDVAPAAVDRTVTISYTAVVRDVSANVRGSTLVNGASLLWRTVNGTDPTTANPTGFTQNTAVSTSTVTLTEPTLTIAKAADDITPEPGQAITYTVTVANPAGANKGPAYNVVVKDVLPVGLVTPTAISNGGSYDAPTRTITWTLAGPLNAPGQVALTYQTKLSTPSPSGGLTNTATVTGYDGLPSGGRHYTGPDASVTVKAALPHVRIAKTVLGGPTAYIGQSKSWQVVVTSDGDGPAYGIDVRDVLPPNWSYDAGSAQVSVAGATSTHVEPAVSGQTLTWTDLGNLPVKGQTVVVVFSATPGANVVTNPGIGNTVNHTNTAATTAEDAEGRQQDADGHAYNGGPSTAVAKIASADVRIVKSHTGDPIAGSPFSWSLAVSNAGPDTAAGPFTVTDTLPAALSGSTVTASGTGWTCSVSPGPTSVSCTRVNAADTLASGSSFPGITVTAQLPSGLAQGTDLTNTATVAAQTHDPDGSNNTSTDPATVQVRADLRVQKSQVGPFVAGELATYQLDVDNRGPSVHRGLITVTDQIPAGTSYVSVSGGASWSCGQSGGTVTCTRNDDRPIGPMPTITVTVRVDSDRTSAVQNSATVTGTLIDPVPGNNTDDVTVTPTTSADLALTKTSEGNSIATPWANGENHSYLLTLVNHGPSTAHGPVKITDTIPAGMSYLGFESVDGTWSCSQTGTLVTCTLTGDLDPDETVAVRLKIAIAPGSVGPYENSAHATSVTPDPDPDNNTATDTTDTVDRTDFSLAKKHPAGPVHAGETVTFTLVATNHGPTRATAQVRIVDVLPDGMSYQSASGTGWTCAPAAGNKVACSNDTDVDPDADLPDLLITVKIAADAGPASLVNVATVSVDSDKNPSNDEATDKVVVTDLAELTLVKTTTGANPVLAGEATSYAVKVTNDGPSDADNLVVTEAPPAGLQVTALSGPGWSCVLATLTCTRATLAADSSSTITVTATVDSATPDGTTLTNVADVATSTPLDPDSTTTDDADVDVKADADLALTKSHATGTAVAGQVTSYLISVHNNGPSDAVGPIKVVDTLPADFTFVSAQNGWTCDASAEPQVVCSHAGPLLAGADAPELEMQVLVLGNVDDGVHTNEATVSSQTPDTHPGNNTDDADVEITRVADVSVVKTHTGPLAIGGRLAFTLAVRNDGPSSARGVVVTDDLPTGLGFVSADGGPDWTCTEAAGKIRCEYDGPLAPDTDAPPITVTVDVSAAAYPGVENTAKISTTTPDDDPTNDSSTDPVVVPPVADLSVVKSAIGTFVVGKPAHYRLRVANHGPTEVPGTVTVTDTLPAGLAFVSGTGPGWTCTAVGQAVTCTKTGLPSGAAENIDLVVDVLPAAYPKVTNTATIGSEATDPDPDNNTSEVPTPVTSKVSLVIAKTVAAQDGNLVTWKLEVTNRGPSSTVTPVTVSDLLPGRLTFVKASGDGFGCRNVARLVTCSHPGAVAAGDKVSVLLVTRLDASSNDPVTNTASVTGGTTEVSPPTDGSATVSVKHPDLPDTGGPRWILVPTGLLLLIAGAVLLVARSRSQRA